MIIAWLACLITLAAMGVLIVTITKWVEGGSQFDLLVRLTAIFAMLSLGSWMDGSTAGVLGLGITLVLAGVLAITWAIRRDYRLIIPDDLSTEDMSWRNE